MVERQIVVLVVVGSSPIVHPITQGYRQVGKALDFDSSMRRFESCYPCHFYVNYSDPLAQPAEHLTFNQGVGRSNRPWVTIASIVMVIRNDVNKPT